MMILKLAYRNLVGAGIRTWLNVIALSFAFVAIILIQGMLEGMNQQIATAITEAEYAGGQYWHQRYDPYDPFTLQDSHGYIPPFLRELTEKNLATPLLIIQGSIYPGGRIQPVLLKGIDPQQKIVSIPSHLLETPGVDLPLLIGNRMAKSSGLMIGDMVTVQWRDVHGRKMGWKPQKHPLLGQHVFRETTVAVEPGIEIAFIHPPAGSRIAL